MPFPRPGPAVLAPVVFVVLAALAACSGSNGTSVPVIGPTPAPTAPASLPTLAPATSATSAPLTTASGTSQTVAIPAAAGITGSIVLPAATVPAGTSLTVQTTTVAPAGVPALAALRSPRLHVSATAGVEVLYYQGISFTQTVTFPAFPAFTIALPAGYNPGLGTFQIAFYNGTGWTLPLGAAGTASGQQLSFAPATGPVTYQANQAYYFALYYQAAPPSPSPSPTAVPSATASPTAVPTASPTAVPSSSPTPVPTAIPVPTATPTPSPTPTPGPLTVTPSVLSFLAAGADQAKTVTVSSSFYTGAFSASACTITSTPAPGASPPPAVATVSAVNANGVFTVTPQAAGACTIDVTDATQRHASVSVTVATSSLTVQSRKH